MGNTEMEKHLEKKANLLTIDIDVHELSTGPKVGKELGQKLILRLQ
jgi:hypothetical protein